jgi:hypothetical protein
MNSFRFTLIHFNSGFFPSVPMNILWNSTELHNTTALKTVLFNMRFFPVVFFSPSKRISRYSPSSQILSKFSFN